MRACSRLSAATAFAFACARSILGATPAAAGSAPPAPPQLPRNFHGKGTDVVKDLGVEVPSTWVPGTATCRWSPAGRASRSG
jgi:hypothetical protein